MLCLLPSALGLTFPSLFFSEVSFPIENGQTGISPWSELEAEVTVGWVSLLPSVPSWAMGLGLPVGRLVSTSVFVFDCVSPWTVPEWVAGAALSLSLTLYLFILL